MTARIAGDVLDEIRTALSAMDAIESDIGESNGQRTIYLNGQVEIWHADGLIGNISRGPGDDSWKVSLA